MDPTTIYTDPTQAIQSVSIQQATQTQGGGQTIFINYDDPYIAKFKIPIIVRDKYADLIKLILETESMNDQERSYWFQIMPIMTTVQIEKLRNILVTEKQQLQALDAKYENEINNLNTKHIQQWKQFENKEKQQQIQAKEEANEKEEVASEEELLNQLEGI